MTNCPNCNSRNVYIENGVVECCTDCKWPRSMTEETKAGPLPCPFCGRVPILEYGCENLNCRVRVEADTLEAWNTRAIPSQPERVPAESEEEEDDTDLQRPFRGIAHYRRQLAARDARIAELEQALTQIKHSIGQARIIGNDWRRELALIENLTDAALNGGPSRG